MREAAMCLEEEKKHLRSIWNGMKQRCYSKRDCEELRWWKGKGITVCQEWLDDFEAFYKWGIEAGYSIGLCLDRIDADKNYEPGNCQWLTRADNARKASIQRKLNRMKN